MAQPSVPQNDISELVEHFRLDAHYRAHELLISYPDRHRRNVMMVDKWTRNDAVGQGTFGIVWLYQESGKDTGKVRAVKQIRKGMSGRQTFRSDCAHELYAMSKLTRYHHLFPEFYGWFEDDHHLSLLMEYFPHGDLDQCVHGPVVEPEVKQIVCQLLAGLQVIHEHHMMHRDLKPQNIFVVERSPDWWIKIGDFGISKRIENTAHLYTTIGSYQFMAPEILDESNHTGYTNAVDMWALGCIVYLLLASSLPFPNRQAVKQYAQDKTELSLQPLFNQGVSATAVEFTETLLSVHPSARPSSRDATRSPWTSNQAEDKVSQEVITAPNHEPVTTYRASETLIDSSLINRADQTPPASRPDQSPTTIKAKGQSILDTENAETVNIEKTWSKLLKQKKYVEAEKMLQQVADGRKKTLGSEHMDTLACIYWIGKTLYKQEKYAEAEKMFQQTADGRKKTLGAEHEDTLDSINRMGQTLYQQRKYTEAEKMFQQVADKRKKTLSAEHKDTLDSIYWIGLTFYRQRKYTEAEKMFCQAADGRKKTLGAEHKDTLHSIHRIGEALYYQKKYTEAEKLFQQAADGRKKTLGAEHKDTVNSIYWMGQTLYDQKKYTEAEKMFYQAADGRKKILGAEHEDTLDSIYWIGQTLYQQKKYAEAEKMFQQAADGRKKALGAEHVDTLNCISWLEKAVEGQSEHAKERYPKLKKTLRDLTFSLRSPNQ
ncbi:hypothetical protein GJ744_001724 [Endocarpon pusillum]|uniref:Protein kinase domain-containing protein n=1 Tax=Endocarpon pusillum TaxID=364733 RepID=A0A8H7E341_9EURO|nr:hypothetical protein GJ744_001724 [Endocarpon pusillum]